MSSIEKTEAVVLRVTPFSDTSHVVNWLTPGHGAISTVIKGAARPKSPFLGQYDLFYTCELLYYARERNGLHIARECAPVRLRHGFRSNWRAAAYASYLCDMAQRTAVRDRHQEGLYRLITSSLDHLSQGAASESFLFWFEIMLCRELGFAPIFDNCTVCGSPGGNGSFSVFSSETGGVLCDGCSRMSNTIQSPVSSDALSILRKLGSTPSARKSAVIRCSRGQKTAISDILRDFLRFHIDGFLPRSREIVLGL